MGKVNKAIIIAGDSTAAAELACGAAELAEHTELIAAADIQLPSGIEKYIVVDNTLGCAAVAGTVTELAMASGAELILVEQGKNGRLIAASIAAALGRSPLTDSTALRIEDDKVLSSRMVYGGSAIKSETSEFPAVVCIGRGMFSAVETAAGAEAESVSPAVQAGIVFEGRSEKPVQESNLPGAKKVLGVGRGVKSEEDLQLINGFAERLGAEVACTRPLAEEDHLLGRERYIGVSGIMIRPELYIAAGISGQVQHMVGVNEAGVIIAINKDKNAPIFSQCDYGIVGDMYQVLPAIIEKLD